ncbi:MAG: hypothetical protein ACRDOM_11230 [Nocardioides sp.]
MVSPDEFDAFYKDARSRLLLETYALTGDLTASRSAVRDSFVVAWHHWRKVSRLADRAEYVRAYAWQHAQRRRTARLWHRDKRLDRDSRATLDALGKLPVVQRKALLLTQLTTISLADMAREIGLTRAEGERQLQIATSRFAVHRDVPSTSLRSLFDSLRPQVDQVSWPRPSIIRRAGAARRRSHTLIGAGAAVAAVLVSGTLVTDPAGARPTLAGGPGPGATSRPEAGEPTQAPPEFSGERLLSAEQVSSFVPGRRWEETSTSDNTSGNGLILPCQLTRYADPSGVSALVRRFDTTPSARGPKASAIQTTELSESKRSARKAFRTTLGWFAGCAEQRFQLLTTRAVDNVGDDSRILVLRSWQGDRPTIVVGVARTGRLTATTLSSTTRAGPADLRSSSRLLAAAVNGLCALPEADGCATRPRLRSVPPIPAAEAPGMIAEVDLPPVGRIRKPWVGTEARRAVDNDAATPCDQTSFNRRSVSHNLTRTFLIPDAGLADQFGLTETVGTMSSGRARAFVREVEDRIARCGRKDLGSEVTRLAGRSTRQVDLTAWRVTSELNDARSVTFLMGIVRDRTAVAQLGFVPSRDVTMRARDFVNLLRRAGERLPAMPPPR